LIFFFGGIEMNKEIVLTGIKPTGKVHVGNYINAIKPALQIAQNSDCTALYFIADYHGLTAVQDRNQFNELSYSIAATWLALGLDPERVVQWMAAPDQQDSILLEGAKKARELAAPLLEKVKQKIGRYR
jgi:tryptophanyl-tRNA synthetase